MSTGQRRLPKEEIAGRGEEIFDREVRPRLQKEEHGQFVAIDVESGAYEIDPDEMTATTRLRARQPNAQTWITRVGFDYVRRYGPRRRTPQ